MHSSTAPPTPIDGQTIEQLGGRRSVLARQRKDHICLEVLLRSIESATTDEQDRLITKLRHLVFPHAFAEEAVLWPALRRIADDGHELTLKVEQEHQEINELFASLERTKSGDTNRVVLLEQISALLRQDAHDEETALLPRLQQALTTEELRRLGRQWEAVRRTAPTRPHAVVARRPPGNVLAALPLTFIDRSRDGLDFVARTGPRPLSAATSALSRGLRRVGVAVEHLPPLRKGEDPSTRTERSAQQ